MSQHINLYCKVSNIRLFVRTLSVSHILSKFKICVSYLHIDKYELDKARLIYE